MKTYFETLKAYVREHPPDYGDQDAHSLLEFLYHRYNDYNGMDTQEITSGFATLYQRLHGKSLQDLDKIIDTVCLLCLEHEKSGFVNGVKIGVRLGERLTTENLYPAEIMLIRTWLHTTRFLCSINNQPKLVEIV